MRCVKVIAMVTCLLLLANTKTFSQTQPSLYTGIGLGTNLGSVCGIGAEIKYSWISFNIAIGPGIMPLSEHAFLYDAGIKLYSKNNFFGGINYGFIRTVGLLLDKDKKDYYGFTFSLGYRFRIYKHLYGMGYLGATSDYLSFMPKEKKEQTLIPRIGFIVGYEF